MSRLNLFICATCLAFVLSSSTGCLLQNHPLLKGAESPSKQPEQGKGEPAKSEQNAPAQNPLAAMLGLPQMGQPLDPNALNAAGANLGNINSSNNVSELCYEHECNGHNTGRKCFGDKQAYCQAMCAEDNCASRIACDQECR